MRVHLRRIAAIAVTCTAFLVLAAPGGAVIEPSPNASCLGQFVFFLAQTSSPNLGQAIVAPGATSAPGAVAGEVVPDATAQPHTLHCSP
jgi:hypothetical protein